MTDMMSTVSSKVQSNNLEELKRYLNNDDTVIKENSTAIQYLYDFGAPDPQEVISEDKRLSSVVCDHFVRNCWNPVSDVGFWTWVYI